MACNGFTFDKVTLEMEDLFELETDVDFICLMDSSLFILEVNAILGNNSNG